MSYGRGYGGGGRDFGGPKPVEAGKQYDVQVTEISRQGDGIARVQGFVIFVKGGRVGQKTKVRIISVGPRFATGEIAAEESKQVAPQRTEEEKPELQDYKSTEAADTEERPPT